MVSPLAKTMGGNWRSYSAESRAVIGKRSSRGVRWKCSPHKFSIPKYRLKDFWWEKAEILIHCQNSKDSDFCNHVEGVKTHLLTGSLLAVNSLPGAKDPFFFFDISFQQPKGLFTSVPCVFLQQENAFFLRTFFLLAMPSFWVAQEFKWSAGAPRLVGRTPFEAREVFIGWAFKDIRQSYALCFDAGNVAGWNRQRVLVIITIASVVHRNVHPTFFLMPGPRLSAHKWQR